MQNSITFLDRSGDTTIAWDDTNSDQMIPLIEKKLSEGFSFFILESRPLIKVPDKKVLVSDIEKIKAEGYVIIEDKDIQSFFASNTVAVAETPSEIKTVRKSKTPREIARKQSVAVKPQKGG